MFTIPRQSLIYFYWVQAHFVHVTQQVSSYDSAPQQEIYHTSEWEADCDTSCIYIAFTFRRSDAT